MKYVTVALAIARLALIACALPLAVGWRTPLFAGWRTTALIILLVVPLAILARELWIFRAQGSRAMRVLSAVTILAAANRIGVAADVIRRTLDGRLKVSPAGAYRSDPRYLLVGRAGAARPDPVQAAWLYAQMVRWGQAPLSREMLIAALTAILAAHALVSGHGEVCTGCKAGRRTLAEVQRLKQKYG